MKAIAESWEPGIYYRKRLEIWILALEGRADVILDRLRSHDHVSTAWLSSTAAQFLLSRETREALEWAAINLPDENCRRECCRELESGKWPK
jgi:hypothetical protein